MYSVSFCISYFLLTLCFSFLYFLPFSICSIPFFSVSLSRPTVLTIYSNSILCISFPYSCISFPFFAISDPPLPTFFVLCVFICI